MRVLMPEGQKWKPGSAFYKTEQIYELAQLLNIDVHLANAQHQLGEALIAEAMQEANSDLQTYLDMEEPFRMAILGLNEYT